jgi:hypothetical protein
MLHNITQLKLVDRRQIYEANYNVQCPPVMRNAFQRRVTKRLVVMAMITSWRTCGIFKIWLTKKCFSGNR